MLLPLLGSAAVGGLIGYGTNWLAIRMLFWPLEEKRLFGHKVPFTPGLIPKKRARLASALGDTVASHLVTPATLTSALSAPELRAQVAEALGQAWAAATRDDKTLSELLQESGASATANQLAERAWAMIEQRMQHAGPADWSRQAVAAIGPALFGAYTRQFRQAGAAELQQISQSLRDDQAWRQALDQTLVKLADSWQQQATPLGQLLPDAVRDGLRQLILAHGPDWLDHLQAVLQTESSRTMIKGLIKQLLAGNTVLKLAAAFIDQERLAAALPALLTREEVRTELCNLALGWLDRAWELPVNRAFALLCPEGATPERVRSWSDSLLSREWFSPGRQSALDQAGSPAWPLLQSELGMLLQPFAPLLQRLWQSSLADQQVQLALRVAFDRLLAQLLDTPVRRLLPEAPPDRFSAWSEQVCQWLTNLATRHGQSLLAALRLPQVVEAQVNGMDIVDVEEILLQVMREQLRAITNLGFLLGAAVGLILPSLNVWLASL